MTDRIERIRARLRGPNPNVTRRVSGAQSAPDSHYGGRASLAEELLEDIEGSPALEGFEYDDQKALEGEE